MASCVGCWIEMRKKGEKGRLSKGPDLMYLAVHTQPYAYQLVILKYKTDSAGLRVSNKTDSIEHMVVVTAASA